MTGTVSHHAVKIIAALIWYSGGIVLLLKGGQLLLAAHRINPAYDTLAIASVLAVVVGLVKARYLFLRACLKNLERIAALEMPHWWQCYRPRFFLFLACMIALGGTLSRMAEGDFHFMLGVAMLDFSVATALLVSSIAFWRSE